MPRDPSTTERARPGVEMPERRAGYADARTSAGASAGTSAGAGHDTGARCQAADAARTGAVDGPVAVIVSHGMGEQVPFETLNVVAEALWAQQSSEPMDPSSARVRYVAFGDDWLPRVELALRMRDGSARRVHLYEVYWAPLTEGKVTARDAIAFLIGAGVRGMRYCARGSFDRWMFGRRVVFPLPRRGVVQLGAALAALLALLLAFLGVAAAAVAELGRFLHPGALPPPPRWLPSLPDPWMLVALAASLVVFAALRWFLVQSVGDVAAYISAHRASRFARIRRAIQDTARGVARNVYAARDEESGEPAYAHVLVVGHSLGSVIAYDMLNDSINLDLAATAGEGNFLDVVRRTRLLLTLGSPLDKTAFLFRTQKDHAPLREALAAAAQPMIVSYESRPARWINIWSPFDWISGSLEYYDDATPPHGGSADGDTSNVDVSPGAGSTYTSTVDVSCSVPSRSSDPPAAYAASGSDPSVVCTARSDGPAAPMPRSHSHSVQNIRERGVPLDTVRAHLGYWKRAEFGKHLFEAIASCNDAGAVSAGQALLPATRPSSAVSPPSPAPP